MTNTLELTGSDILWQSARYPRLFLTESHLSYLKKRFPRIPSFYNIMLDIEHEMGTTYKRRRNFRKVIDNRCKIEVEIIVRRNAKAERHAQYGDAARNNQVDPRPIGAVLRNIMNGGQ